MESEDSDPNKWILSGTCLLLSDDWAQLSPLNLPLIDLFEIIYKDNPSFD